VSNHQAQLLNEAGQLAREVISRFGQRGLSLATCESLTGGLIGATLTSVPGSSRVYRGGLITYHSDLKVALARVDAQWVAEAGVVNASTARQMAAGAAMACGADVAVAVTGVAGPDPSDGQPVGTVWMGLALPADWDEPSRAQSFEFPGDRGEIRAWTSLRSLQWLLEVASES